MENEISSLISIELENVEGLNERELNKIYDDIRFKNFEWFLDYYLNLRNLEVRIYSLNQYEKKQITSSIRTLFINIIHKESVIAKLENGWILGTYNVHFYFGNGHDFSMTYEEMSKVEWFHTKRLFKSICSFKNNKGIFINVNCDDMELYRLFFINLNKAYKKWNLEVEKTLKSFEKERIKKLQSNQNDVLKKLDKNGDGIVDLVDNDLNKLLNLNQKSIIEFDKSYIHQFIKVSNYIKIKSQNIQKLFESIKETSNQKELQERVNLLQNQIHTYELLVFHSLNMIGSLVKEDLITFYEIYETFDKLGIYKSNWENEVSTKLENIGSKLDELLYSIYRLEQSIVNELTQLSYVTQDSFYALNNSLINQLQEVESSINTNNLLSGIQSYQLYKLNRH
jgi:hypothetical protein